MVSQLYALEEVRQDAVVALQELQVYSRIKGKVKGELPLLHTKDIVDEAVEILLLDQIPRRKHFQVTLKQRNHAF